MNHCVLLFENATLAWFVLTHGDFYHTLQFQMQFLIPTRAVVTVRSVNYVSHIRLKKC